MDADGGNDEVGSADCGNEIPTVSRDPPGGWRWKRTRRKSRTTCSAVPSCRAIRNGLTARHQSVAGFCRPRATTGAPECGGGCSGVADWQQRKKKKRSPAYSARGFYFGKSTKSLSGVTKKKIFGGVGGALLRCASAF